MITGHKKHLIARCKERGYALADVMPCVVKQDGDTWTVDVDHPAYPRAKKRAVVKQDAGIEVVVSQRRKVCSGCRWLRHTKYDQPYCRRHCKRNGKKCQPFGVGKYQNALLNPEPWCKPWKKAQRLARKAASPIGATNTAAPAVRSEMVGNRKAASGTGSGPN